MFVIVMDQINYMMFNDNRKTSGAQTDFVETIRHTEVSRVHRLLGNRIDSNSSMVTFLIARISNKS